MFITLLQHQWKSFIRSSNFGKSVLIQIFMGLLLLYFAANFLAMGFFMGNILGELFPNRAVVISFNGFLVYYFLLDACFRFLLQPLSTLNIPSYLHLNVKRKTLAGFLSIGSAFNIYNLFPLLILLPFAGRNVLNDPSLHGASWLVSIIALILFSNYLIVYIKRIADTSDIVFFAFFVVIILLGALDYYKIFSLSAISVAVFNKPLTQPIFVLIPLSLFAIIYFVHHQYLKSNLYLDELRTKKKEHKSSLEIPILSKLGHVGELIALEIKLIWRNKRPKSLAVRSLLIMFYGLLFYKGQAQDFQFMYVFIGLFTTGITIINYGQFMNSWQSSYFDLLLTSDIKATDFFKSKYLLLASTCGIYFLLMLPYFYFGWRVVAANLAMCLYNMGINVFWILYFSNYNYKRISLSAGARFNWQGASLTQFLIGMPLILFPMIIYGIIKVIFSAETALIVLGLTGMAGIILHQSLLKVIVSKFKRQKYKIAEGFRQQ